MLPSAMSRSAAFLLLVSRTAGYSTASEEPKTVMAAQADSTLPWGFSAGAIGAIPTIGVTPTQHGGIHGNEVIPRTIWTFWNNPFFPPIVAACVSAMHKLNPSWVVRLVGPDGSGLEKPPLGSRKAFEEQPALEADWYRLAAIARFGGVYLDSTVITPIELGEGENAWPDMNSPQLQGFNCPNTNNGTDPVCLESFAFAAPANTPLVVRWKEEFAKALKMGCKEYGDALPDDVAGNLREHLPYLCVYAAFQAAHKQLPDEPLTTYWSQGCAMAGGHCGPYRYMETAPEGEDNVVYAFTTPEESWATTHLIKFMSGARNFLIENPDVWYTNSSGWLARTLTEALPMNAYKGQIQQDEPA